MVELLVRELAPQESVSLVYPDIPDVHRWADSLGGVEKAATALARAGAVPGWLLPGRLRQLFALFKRARVVHIHLHTPFSCTAAIVLARFAGVSRIVTTEHYIAQLAFLRRRQLAAPLAMVRGARIALDTMVKRWSLRFIDDVVTLSEGNRSVFESFASPRSRPRVHTIHNGIDLRRFPPGQPGEQSHPLHPGAGHALVTTVAGLNNQKGHAYLIRAVPEVLRKAPRTRFLLVGDGHLRGGLEAMVASLGLSHAVMFAGNRDDVASILASTDLFVLPSLFEGMPMSVLEAMAAGCAVVATDVGGTQDVVVSGQTGLLVPPEDSGALAEAILELLSDEEKRQAFARNGRRRIELNFSAARMGERYSALLHETGTTGRA